MKHSDFKCSCGGSGKTTYNHAHDGRLQHISCIKCKGKPEVEATLTATEVIPLEVPEGYELRKEFLIKLLPNKVGDKQTFMCEECGERLKECEANDHCNLEDFEQCPQCKGKPEIHAELKEITVEGHNLIERWEE